MNKRAYVNIGLAVLAVMILAMMIAPQVVAQIEDWTTFTGIRIQATSYATATPLLMVENNGASNSLEIRNSSATPVFYVDADGNATYTGFSSGGGTVGDTVRIAAPTAVGTATPALVVDSLGAGNVLLDVRDAATPVFSINNGGGWTSTGAGTHSSGQTINNWAKVAAPTAIATATPAMVVDSLGVSTILEIRDAATPVARFPNGGGLDITVGDLEFLNGEKINNTTDGFIGYTGGQLWSMYSGSATEGLVITPTVYSVYNLDSAGAVTITLAPCTEGGPVVLVGDDANTITIADTNIRTNDGAAAAIGQYDVWIGICADGEWIEISNAVNQ